MFGIPEIPSLLPLLTRGVEALERLADAQEHANRLAAEPNIHRKGKL